MAGSVSRVKAVIHERYGPPSLLRVAEVPKPTPKPDEVLLAVRAASEHADVWHTIRGWPYLLRVMGNGVRRPKYPIPGKDAAGVVVEVGSAVTQWSVGDEVYGEIVQGIQWLNGGAFAEFAVAKETTLVPKPPGLSWVEAAAIPTAALIALRALQVDAQVKPGMKVVVNGAAGGVGMFVVMIARALGAQVTAVDAADRFDLLEKIGAEEMLDYRTLDYTEVLRDFDLVVDIPGNRPFSSVRQVLKPEGKYLLIGHDAYGTQGHRVLGSVPKALSLVARGSWTAQLPKPDFSSLPPEAMDEINEMAVAGKITPVIDRTFPLAEAGAAIAYLASGSARGKVVLEVSAH